jgi:toxin ParE1/3/4
MILVWSEAARAELKQIIAYIAERNSHAASELGDRIEACAESLTNHPFMYRIGRAKGTREAVVHPNYIVIYEVGVDSVTIRSVIHSRRQYPPGD